MDDIFANIEMGTVISCPVCRDTYSPIQRYPINVPCGHTFCGQCAISLLPTTPPIMLICPVCRKKHYSVKDTTNSGTPGGFPKNYQLLEVIEKVIEVKKKSDQANVFQRVVACRECKNESAEENCTTCGCIKDHPNGEKDFMDRSKNMLICMNCISVNHTDHDVKPMSTVKVAFDNFKLTHDINEIVKRIQEKAQTTAQSLNNSQAELDALVKVIGKTVDKLSAKPKDGVLFCAASKYYQKLVNIEKNIVDMGTRARTDTARFGCYSELFRQTNYFARPANIRPMLAGIVQRPAGVNPNPPGVEDNLRLVVRFADNRNPDHMQELANRIAAARENPERVHVQRINLGDEDRRQPEVIHDMLRGIFDIMRRADEAAAPADGPQAGNRQLVIQGILDDEDDDDDELEPIQAEAGEDNGEVPVAGDVAAQDDEVVEDVAAPVAEEIVDAVVEDVDAPVAVPEVPARRRGRPRAQPPVEQEGAARARRGAQVRHDPIRQEPRAQRGRGRQARRH